MRNKSAEEKLKMWKKRDSVRDYFFKSIALTTFTTILFGCSTPISCSFKAEIASGAGEN